MLFLLLNEWDLEADTSYQPMCSEAHCTTGYSPFLHFDVDDLDGTVQRLLSLGAFLDGPIKYPTHGKVRRRILRSGWQLG